MKMIIINEDSGYFFSKGQKYNSITKNASVPEDFFFVKLESK